MITIGIETSGHQGSVALLQDSVLLGESDLSREGRRHARTLVPELQRLLQGSSIAPGDVDTLAVSIGPGSFTGLRVGVACAKTWAYASGAQVVAVNTLLAVACQCAPKTRTVQVISDAQRGELFVGRFGRRDEHDWEPQGEIQIVPTDTWIASLHKEDVVSGPGVARLTDRLASTCQLEAEPHRLPAARTIARLGAQAARTGRTDDVWSLEPLYLRKSAAEEKAEARDQKGSASA